MAWFNSTAVGEDLCSWNVIIARRVKTPIVRRRNSNVESIKTKLDETTEFHDGRALLFFQTFPPVWILMPPFQHLYQTSGTYRAPFLLLHLLKSIIHHIRIYLQHPSLLLRQKMGRNYREVESSAQRVTGIIFIQTSCFKVDFNQCIQRSPNLSSADGGVACSLEGKHGDRKWLKSLQPVLPVKYPVENSIHMDILINANALPKCVCCVVFLCHVNNPDVQSAWGSRQHYIMYVQSCSECWNCGWIHLLVSDTWAILLERRLGLLGCCKDFPVSSYCSFFSPTFLRSHRRQSS